MAEGAPAEARAAPAGVVLLVEDEPLVLLSTADLLGAAGYEVLKAEDSKAAVALLEQRPETSTLVTDINVPGRREGIDLAWLVAERWPHVRIVIVSGQERPKSEEYPQKAVFFTKPYADGALLTMIGGAG